jgi:hypothetical protein
MLAAVKDLLHRKPKYFHPNGDDVLDHETLLSDSSSPPIPLKPSHQPRSSLSVALTTLLPCSIVYTSAEFWVMHSPLKAKTVPDADEWCMHLISAYCKLYCAKQKTGI